jgi:F-type H+-transporting ATPase subunit gamma
MPQNPEKAKLRLENMQAIEPLLMALRTISLANWNLALKKQKSLKSYACDLENIYFFLNSSKNIIQTPPSKAKSLIFILGSNRGLCGNFNSDISNFTKDHIPDLQTKSTKFIIVGSRLLKRIKRKNLNIDKYESMDAFNSITLESVSQVFDHYQLHEPENRNTSVIYNHYQGAGKYQTKIIPLFGDISSRVGIGTEEIDQDTIIDTNVDEMISRLIIKLGKLALYSAFLSSAASEHSTRFQLMESASKNAEKISDEVAIEIQLQRRQKITSEMRELAIGAGLLDNI